MAAIVVKIFNGRKFYILLCFITIAYTILNWGNRKIITEINDKMLAKQSIVSERPGGVDVISPIWIDPYKPWIGKVPKKHIEIISGTAEIIEVSRSITKHEYVIYSTIKTYLKENTSYFPGWRILLNNKEVPINYHNKEYPGVITFNLDKGLYKADIVFTDTPIRKYSKWISLASFFTMWLGLFL